MTEDSMQNTSFSGSDSEDELMSAGKQNENLKISIANSEDPESGVVFLKLENYDVLDDSLDTVANVTVNVGNSVTLAKDGLNKEGHKVYENKGGNFETGIDITSKETKDRVLKRAKRFGVVREGNDKKMDIEALYESLGISKHHLEESEEGTVRLRKNVVHMRGVDELSTHDIFHYFRSYPPRQLEWINDTSCNVIFPDASTCYRALLNLSDAARPLPSSDAKKRLGNKPTEVDDDIINLMDDDDEQTTPNSTPDMENTREDKSELPTDRWRIAHPCGKSKSVILVRFATTSDVKQRGSEGRSEYYKKFGNPNYGGLTGLISKSKKRRFRQDQQKHLEREAQEAVSQQGRSKVTYNDEDDMFGDTYDEAESAGGGRQERAGVRQEKVGVRQEMNDIIKQRRRMRDTLNDDDADLSSVLNKRRRKEIRPANMKMAADQEEERINTLKAQRDAYMEAVDSRHRIEKLRRDKHLLRETDYIESVQVEPVVTVDLRSKLSRLND